MGRCSTPEEDARWTPYDDPYDPARLQVDVRRRDEFGRHAVHIRCNGQYFADVLDVFDAFKRKKCREAAISKCQLPDDAHLDIEERLLAGAEAADSRVDTATRPNLIRLSDVKAAPIEPLWNGRINVGKLTLLVGEPGLGKSFLTKYIAAQVSTGRPWPDSLAIPQPIGGVVLANAEDDLGDTVRVRLDAHEADCSRIVAIQSIKSSDADGDHERGLDLARDIDHVRAAIDSVDNCRLVIFDPISAYFGRIDTHKNSDVRSVLGPLAALAAEKRVAVLAVTHLRKGEGSAKHRTMGSIAFVAAARSAWLVTEDAADPTRRLLLPIKNNLSVNVGGLAFAIKPYGPDGAPCVCWEHGAIDVSADDAMEHLRQPSGRKPIERADAAEWLSRQLEGGPKPASSILNDATIQGFNRRTVQRAFEQLGCERFKAGFRDGWKWSLPQDDTEDDTLPLSQAISHPGHLRQNPEENTLPSVTNRYSVGESDRLCETALDAFNAELANTNGHDETPF